VKEGEVLELKNEVEKKRIKGDKGAGWRGGGPSHRGTNKTMTRIMIKNSNSLGSYKRRKNRVRGRRAAVVEIRHSIPERARGSIVVGNKILEGSKYNNLVQLKARGRGKKGLWEIVKERRYNGAVNTPVSKMGIPKWGRIQGEK